MLLLLFSCILMIFTLATGEISWYFKKNNEHKQPLLDKQLEFINNYSCYYLDSNHGDECEDKVIYLTFDGCYFQIITSVKNMVKIVGYI